MNSRGFPRTCCCWTSPSTAWTRRASGRCGSFSSGFVKNICCAQPRRASYVLSKALAAGVYSAVITLLGGVLILLAPYLCGMHPAPCAVSDILRYLFWLWLPHWAFALPPLWDALAEFYPQLEAAGD